MKGHVFMLPLSKSSTKYSVNSDFSLNITSKIITNLFFHSILLEDRNKIKVILLRCLLIQMCLIQYTWKYFKENNAKWHIACLFNKTE